MKHTYDHNKLTVKVEFDLFAQLPQDIWRWLVKYIAGFRCEHCRNIKRLQAHHIDQNHNNDCLVNGICLCISCHRAIHKILEEKRDKSLDELIKAEVLTLLERGQRGGKFSGE